MIVTMFSESGGGHRNVIRDEESSFQWPDFLNFFFGTLPYSENGLRSLGKLSEGGFSGVALRQLEIGR